MEPPDHRTPLGDECSNGLMLPDSKFSKIGEKKKKDIKIHFDFIISIFNI